MPQYALLLYNPVDDPRSPEEMGAELPKGGAYTQGLHDNGQFVAGEPLQGLDSATTVRERGGEIQLTDGPFAETKDLIAGWMVIDVDTHERALELAGELSAAPGQGGKPVYEWLEVRPFLSAPPTITE